MYITGKPLKFGQMLGKIKKNKKKTFQLDGRFLFVKISTVNFPNFFRPYPSQNLWQESNG
jgi:hypothetical protein